MTSGWKETSGGIWERDEGAFCIVSPRFTLYTADESGEPDGELSLNTQSVTLEGAKWFAGDYVGLGRLDFLEPGDEPAFERAGAGSWVWRGRRGRALLLRLAYRAVADGEELGDAFASAEEAMEACEDRLGYRRRAGAALAEEARWRENGRR